MAYTKTTWRNNQSPAINADNLNHIEQGVYEAHQDIAENTQNIENLTTQTGANTSAIALEKTQRQQADTAETLARENADNLLSARMDTFTQLPSGSTSGDAELIDIRVGADGVTYPTAGDAVRGQVTDVKSAIDYDTNELDNINTQLGLNDLAWRGYRASASVSSNVITITSPQGWGLGYINKRKLKLSNSSYLEYILLSTIDFGPNKYAIGIAVNSDYFGKLLAIKINNSNTFAFESSSILSGATYKSTNVYEVVYNGSGVFTFFVNDASYTIDLSSYSKSLDGQTITFDKPVIGLIVNASHAVSVNIFQDSIVEWKNEADKTLKYLIPTYANFNEKSFDAVGATFAVNDDQITIASDSSISWAFGFINSYNLKFKNVQKLEYFILSKYQDYAIAITLNSSNYGKLLAIKSGGTNTYAFDSTNYLLGTSYSADNIYQVKYEGDGVYSVYVNGVRKEVDLSEVSITVSGVSVVFDTPVLGAVVHVNSTPVVIKYYQDVTSSKLSEWDGKKWFAFGDSITDMGYYISTVNLILGTASTKFGHSGYSYAQLANVYTEMITGTTPDLITLFAGTNDFGHSGTIADMQTGMETIINGLYTAYPKVQLIIITPLQRNFDASGTPTETSGLGPNSLGKYLIDYVEVIREIAEKYSIPCLDFYSMGGINAINALSKTTDGLHPNNSYGVNLGYMIAEFVKGYKPFN